MEMVYFGQDVPERIFVAMCVLLCLLLILTELYYFTETTSYFSLDECRTQITGNSLEFRRK